MRIDQKHLSSKNKVAILVHFSVFYCSHWLCFSNEIKVAFSFLMRFQPEREMTFETGNPTALTNEAIWPGRILIGRFWNLEYTSHNSKEKKNQPVVIVYFI